jgi:PHD/YefM family antitoxin component YafN of YafNO toxin-antitoxin module
MKTVSVTEFRSNIKKYLEIALEEKVVIHRSKGTSFVIVPLDDKNEESLLNNSQEQAINEALESVEKGSVYTHENAMQILKERHPKYFK